MAELVDSILLGMVGNMGTFVGMFIAKISRGRTFRQLIGGVLIVPSLITFLWMAVFGGSALKIEQDSRHSFEKQQAALIKTAEPTSESSKNRSFF